MANENEMNTLADRMARAYEQGDLDGVAACYAPDAILWHNFDGSEQTVADQLDATRWLGENLKDLRYEVVARHFWDDGYVQQQVVHGTLIKNGEPFAMPTCMNVTVRDGLVTRTVFPTIPPRVDYELTDLGRGLSKPVEALGKWAMEHQTEI